MVIVMTQWVLDKQLWVRLIPQMLNLIDFLVDDLVLGKGIVV